MARSVGLQLAVLQLSHCIARAPFTSKPASWARCPRSIVGQAETAPRRLTGIRILLSRSLRESGTLIVASRPAKACVQLRFLRLERPAKCGQTRKPQTRRPILACNNRGGGLGGGFAILGAANPRRACLACAAASSGAGCRFVCGLHRNTSPPYVNAGESAVRAGTTCAK